MALNINKKAIVEFYDNYQEDARLTKSRHGQLEFLTTMHYIHKYLKSGMKILEVGAGTGRYSIALAKEGYEVTAVELVKSNLDVLKENAKGVKNLKALQGDALDLSKLKDSYYDMVLVLGPLYHLYNKADQTKAIDEALRVCKNNGILMFAFIPVYNFVVDYGMKSESSLIKTIKENFTDNFLPRQFPEQMFTGFNVDDFKKLFKQKQFKPLHMISADSILQIEEDRNDFAMTDEEFDLYFKFHLATCERPYLLGFSAHLLYIGKKIS